MANVKATVIRVGDEVIKGRIEDINSSFIAKRLSEIGVNIIKIIWVGDDRDYINQCFREAIKESDIVISSGGLGSTLQDYTKEVIADIFKKRLGIDTKLLTKLREQFKMWGKPMPGLITKQALIPKGALVLENPIGITPGIILSEKGKLVISLPETYEELVKMCENSVIPYIEGKYSLPPIQTAILRTGGISETEIHDRLNKLMKTTKHTDFSFVPQPTGVDITITFRGRRGLKRIIKEAERILFPHVYATDKKTIETVVGEILRKKAVMLAVAESCTGGLIGNMITNVPGSSEYFIGSIVAYSDKLKIGYCGIKKNTLKEYGAVSEQVAKELAEGVREKFGADIGLSVTGIAGPEGGTEEKPVGLVYSAISDGNEIIVEKHIFSGTRTMIKEKSAYAALDLTRKFLLGLV